MDSAAPRDPVAIVESMQAELARLSKALIAPGPLCPAARVLAVTHVQVIAGALCHLHQTVQRPEQEARHA